MDTTSRRGNWVPRDRRGAAAISSFTSKIPPPRDHRRRQPKTRCALGYRRPELAAALLRITAAMEAAITIEAAGRAASIVLTRAPEDQWGAASGGKLSQICKSSIHW